MPISLFIFTGFTALVFKFLLLAFLVQSAFPCPTYWSVSVCYPVSAIMFTLLVMVPHSWTQRFCFECVYCSNVALVYSLYLLHFSILILSSWLQLFFAVSIPHRVYSVSLLLFSEFSPGVSLFLVCTVC